MPFLSSATLGNNFGRCKVRLGPYLCIPGGSSGAVCLQWQESFALVLIEFSGRLVRICCNLHIPPAKVHRLFETQRLVLWFFPPKLNLFYISHGRTKRLWVFDCQNRCGSDGTWPILVEEWEDCSLLGRIFRERKRVILIQTKLFNKYRHE